ncbi:TPA: DUF4238 domain-containing protein [Serratia marcescens]
MIDRNIKRNQHFVPQSYLRRFTIKDERSLLWNFDKKVKDYLRSPSSVNRICCEDYYYYQIDEQGGVNHIALEDAISEIEKIGNDCISEVINMSAMPYAYLSIEKRANIAFYIALMQTRGPAFRDAINNIYGDMAVRALEATFEDKILPEAPAVLRELIEEKGLLQVVKPSILTTVSLMHMIESARQISNSFLEKQWTLLISHKGHEFITSDNPVTFYSKSQRCGVGPGHPNATIIFPISPNLCMCIEKGDESQEDAKLNIQIKKCKEIDQIRINNLIFDGALSNVFVSSKKDWLEIYSRGNESAGQKITTIGGNPGFDIIINPFNNRKKSVK